MSGGGDVRVLRQEAGQESPRMPAWKREILERRKAKGGGVVASSETSPSGGAGAQRLNGETSETVNGSGGGTVNSGGGRNYTITPASQHYSHNKETRPAAAERTTSREEEEEERGESLVLQESLGPLEENPFIKLEKERRRRQDRENSTRPTQHILELYGSVPGIRTIRADNIIIIESDPDYFPEVGPLKAGSKWQTNGVSGYSSLNDLLDRRGSAVTEIRAKEVVIYDTTLSKSEENLSTLGYQDLPPYCEVGPSQGRVSRMLQKFDSNYGKLQKKSHSTENLLDLDCGASNSIGSRPQLWRQPQQPDPVPKPGPGSVASNQPLLPVIQSSWSSKAKPQPDVLEPGSPQRTIRPLHATPSPRGGRDEPDRVQSKLARERDWESSEVPPKPKVPCSPETRRARAVAPSSPISSKVVRSTPGFEIRPAPKPDLQQIPEGDTQARALANLRIQSRNSFTVIPKRHLTASRVAPAGPVMSSLSDRGTEVPAPGVPISPTLTKSRWKEERKNEVERVTPKTLPSPTVATSPKPSSLPPADRVSPPPGLSPTPLSPTMASSPPSSPAAPPSPLIPTASAPEKPQLTDQLPVTNIDEIEVEQHQRFPVPSPLVQRRKGNTFTVVPKRRADPEAQPSSPEPQQDAVREASPGSTPPQPPYPTLGTQLKKRYPAVEEIEVIGGYLSLAKSCLLKTGSTGRKVRLNEWGFFWGFFWQIF